MLHVGVADHLGWAVLVTADGDTRVVDRRRVELVGEGVHTMPVHHGAEGRTDEELADLVDEVRTSARRASAAALSQLAEDLGRTIASLSLRVWPADFPTDVAVLRRPPLEARADAVMYRQELAAAATARAWSVRTYEVRRVADDAAAALGRPADDLLQAPRAALGPPWTKDHRTAYAAAIVAALSSP